MAKVGIYSEIPSMQISGQLTPVKTDKV